MKYVVILGFMLALVAILVSADCVQNLYGNVVCGEGQCATDLYGKVFCAELGGGAVRDNYGAVKCGVGYCTTDYLGRVWCSVVQGGSAAVDTYGNAICLGGCELGLSELCQEAQ